MVWESPPGLSAISRMPALTISPSPTRRPWIGAGPRSSKPAGSWRRVSADVTPSVVHIESKFETAENRVVEETGSGVIVTCPAVPGYYIVTNRHVIGDTATLQQVSIRLRDGRSFHPTQKWIDRETDLAVLKIDADAAKPMAWGNSDRLEIGNLVLAVGSPFGLSQSVTMGIVSAGPGPALGRT